MNTRHCHDHHTRSAIFHVGVFFGYVVRLTMESNLTCARCLLLVSMLHV